MTGCDVELCLYTVICLSASLCCMLQLNSSVLIDRDPGGVFWCLLLLAADCNRYFRTSKGFSATFPQFQGCFDGRLRDFSHIAYSHIALMRLQAPLIHEW